MLEQMKIHLPILLSWFNILGQAPDASLLCYLAITG